MADRQQQIAEYAAKLSAMWGTSPLSGSTEDEAQAYTDYMNAHPNASPALVYNEINARLELLGGVPSVLGQAAQTEIGTLGGVVTGTGPALSAGLKGATSPGNIARQELGSIPDWLKDFLGAGGVLRIGEGILGVVLIAVGLDKLLSGNAGVASKIAKVVR